MLKWHPHFARLGSTTCDTAIEFGSSAKQCAARCSNCSELFQFLFRPSALTRLHLKDSTLVFQIGRWPDSQAEVCSFDQLDSLQQSSPAVADRYPVRWVFVRFA